MKYLQQLQNKVLVENAALLKGTEGFQVVRTKYKEINLEDEEEQ